MSSLIKAFLSNKLSDQDMAQVAAMLDAPKRQSVTPLIKAFLSDKLSDQDMEAVAAALDAHKNEWDRIIGDNHSFQSQVK